MSLQDLKKLSDAPHASNVATSEKLISSVDGSFGVSTSGRAALAKRRTVHAILRRAPCVLSFGLAPGNAGGWGAAVVELKGAG